MVHPIPADLESDSINCYPPKIDFNTVKTPLTRTLKGGEGGFQVFTCRIRNPGNAAQGRRNSVFSLMWPASVQIYWNKRKLLHEKRVQLPQDWFGTQTWPPFHCFGTQIWPPWRHVKTHNQETSSWNEESTVWNPESKKNKPLHV